MNDNSADNNRVSGLIHIINKFYFYLIYELNYQLIIKF